MSNFNEHNDHRSNASFNNPPPPQHNPQHNPYHNPHQNLQNPQGKGKAIAGLVLGIMSFVMVWIPILNIILAAIGLVMAILAKKDGFIAGLQTAAFVVSIIALVASVFWTLMLFIFFVAIWEEFWDEFFYYFVALR